MPVPIFVVVGFFGAVGGLVAGGVFLSVGVFDLVGVFVVDCWLLWPKAIGWLGAHVVVVVTVFVFSVGVVEEGARGCSPKTTGFPLKIKGQPRVGLLNPLPVPFPAFPSFAVFVTIFVVSVDVSIIVLVVVAVGFLSSVAFVTTPVFGC